MAHSLAIHPGMAESAPEDKELVLAPLRDDLQLLPAPRGQSGSPSWTLHDPVRFRFFRIGWMEFEILSRWHVNDAETILNDINRKTALSVSTEQIEALQKFLAANHLLRQNPAAGQDPGQAAKKPAIFKQILHHYLYFKIPLVRPDGFLDTFLPLARFFFSALFWLAIACITTLGIAFTIQQWESFQQTFLYFFSIKGMVYYGLTLFFAKAIHELAHAFTAKQYGLQVPTMGVAFMVLWPVLFTDTTAAWKLTSRKKRLHIGVAGVLAELALAGIATFFWTFLPPGPMKSAMFLLATTTWIITLGINLNPFMRFDGYYILSDLLDTPNLQERAFAFARWFLRRLLLGADEPPPESLSRSRRNTLLLYAFSTWLYRLILFTTIALMVYHLFFKVLGIFLFVVEIGLFIGLPVYRELKLWWRIKSSLRLNIHSIVSIFFFAGCIFLLAFPWNTRVEAPAVYKASAYSRIYPPERTRIREIFTTRGQLVKKGALLFQLDSPELGYLVEKAALDVEMLELKLKRIGFSAKEAEKIQVVEQELTEAITAREGYLKQLERLRITAPFAGEITEMDETIKPGQWVNEKNEMALLVDRSKMVIEGLVREKDLSRIKSGDVGRFYPEELEIAPINGSISTIDPTPTDVLADPYLASVFGGDVAVRQDRKGRLISNEALYRVTLNPEPTDPVSDRILRGTLRLRGESRSLLQRAWVQVVSVVIRESDF